jgi:hypothetical protein
LNDSYEGRRETCHGESEAKTRQLKKGVRGL